jgi:hypothetical protein
MPPTLRYKDHEIVVPENPAPAPAQDPAGAALAAPSPAADLLIDGEPIRYGRFADGQFFLYAHAYDPSDDLAELARRFIDHRDRAEDVRRRREPGAGG